MLKVLTVLFVMMSCLIIHDSCLAQEVKIFPKEWAVLQENDLVSISYQQTNCFTPQIGVDFSLIIFSIKNKTEHDVLLNFEFEASYEPKSIKRTSQDEKTVRLLLAKSETVVGSCQAGDGKNLSIFFKNNSMPAQQQLTSLKIFNLNSQIVK